MAKFNRDFPVSEVRGSLDDNPWLADLLRRWQPAGSENGGIALRLAVRNGYLNFYLSGQSIARVAFKRSRRPRAMIHEKYIHGPDATGQTYVELTSEGYLDHDGTRRPYAGRDIDRSIANAKTYGGEEKAFVDQVVSRNANVVDLEMALPAYRDEASERRAPRMDLVALEPHGSAWRIVFWEAKRVDDKRARCRGEAAPEVCRQLESYTTWLGAQDHLARVEAAYANTCKVIVGLHEIARSVNADIRPLGDAIVSVASGERLTVDRKPRLLIDDRMADASFPQHLQKLRDLGHPVQVVAKGGDMRLETP